MNCIHITSLDDAGLEPYCRMTETQLRNRLHVEQGLFVAESPKVIKVALQVGYEPVSLLCEERHIGGDAAGIIAACGDIPVYTGERELLARMTGYTLTRGVLCAMRRRKLPTVVSVCEGAARVVVIDAVADTTNIGAIFRAAAALGIDGVLLTRDVAMALTDRSVPLASPTLNAEPRLAIVMGTEGDGLPRDTITACDYVARIPMKHGVDSLNVASAAAVAFWELRKPAP